jgi:hypothetical protein
MAAALAAAFLACSGGDGGSAPSDASTSDAAVEDGSAPAGDPAPDGGVSAVEFAVRYCDLLAACCPDRPQCREVQGGRAPYRAAMAEGCLAALQAVAATPTFCTAGFAAAAQACQRVFAAVVASKRLGEPCTEEEECLLSPQGPVRCAGVTGKGHCLVLLPGKEGDGPCLATVGGPLTIAAGESVGGGQKGYLCHVADGLWCSEASSKCEKTKGTGAACTSFGECGTSLHCDDASGRCAPRRDEGATCDVDEQCPSTICGEDNQCAPPPAVDPALARSCLRP